MGDQPAAGFEDDSARDRWMAAGGFVVLIASFRPWFAVHQGASGIQSKTAWTGSSLWCSAVLSGVVATLVWFGAVRGLTDRNRRLVAAGLLLAALGFQAEQWWDMHEGGTITTIAYVYVTDAQGNPLSSGGAVPSPPPRPRWNPLYVHHLDGYNADLQSSHYVAMAALLAMFLIASSAAATTIRRGGGRPPGGG